MNHLRIRRLHWVVALAVSLSASGAKAQDATAMLHIVNAGINLGWVDGIVASEGYTAANASQIGADLTRASSHVSALQSWIASPPYDRNAFVRVNRHIGRLSSEMGGLSQSALRRQLTQILSELRSSLDVFLDARTNRSSVAPTCEGAMVRVGFAFGQAHTAIQRGNATGERRARQELQRAIRAGDSASQRLGCAFAGTAIRAIPALSSQTPATYDASLAPVQAAATASSRGGPATPPAAPQPPRPGTWRGWGNMTLRASGSGAQGTYDDTYESGQGRFRLERSGAGWSGTWEEPNIGRRGRLFRVTVSPDGRTITGRYDVTADGGRGNTTRDSGFRWTFVR